MTGDVWSFSENAAVASEVALAAEGLAPAVQGGPVVVEVGRARDGVRGGGERLVLQGCPQDGPAEALAECISRAAKSLGPAIILVGATREGREVAARLAVKLDVGCLPEASRISSDGKTVSAERSVYAGRVSATLTSPLPCVVTVRPGSFAKSTGATGTVRNYDAGTPEVRVRRLGSSRRETGSVDLKSAKVIVSAGRGVKRKEDLPMLEGLASEMKGALGCSRPLSSDLGWLSEEHHIGLTGVVVKPDLYLAVGISGQLQHIAGMKDSKVVAAVNTDRDAPIFQASDYGIVGDLYQVVPALRKALSARH